ncbi:MAG: DUF362 domain-containing protein [Halobacteriota archaeon]|nr:DUF362 domain-containing protein [Halobacteriota archaeon]
MTKVVIAEGEEMLDLIFNELEVEKVLRNKEEIFIKPNLRAAGANEYKECSITNPSIIESLAEKLLDLGKQVSIGECTSSKFITNNALENSGVKSLEKKGVKVLNLNLYKTKNISINGGVLKGVEVPYPIIESDFIISLPVMKTHCITLVTLSLKNMMGATGGIMPSRLHCAGIHQSIAEINGVIRPDLCIIDATKAMEGSGPVRGKEVLVNTLIGGYDPVSVDSIGARMMGFDPNTIDHITLAEKRGVGKIEPDSILGEMEVRGFMKPGDDGVEFTDFYSHKWFNMLMSNRAIHTLTYDYFYYPVKYLRTKISHRKI